MRIPRFYQAGPLQENSRITLSQAASHHLLQVLRIKPGKQLIVFNDEGEELDALFIQAEKKHAMIDLLSKRTNTLESPLSIELGQGISRGERMDYVIQKSVELGVTHITPLLTSRCEVKLSPERAAKRLAHWQSIAIHACEQSGRCHVPNIRSPLKLETWLQERREGIQLVCDPTSSHKIKDFSKATAATLLIGPEGGLTDSEIDVAKEHGFYDVSLGPRILRTETAAVAALTVLQNQWGDI